MTFEQAERKLLKLSKGRYCSIYYSRTYKDKKYTAQSCNVYIDGFDWYEGRNWNLAFEKLNLAVNQPTMPTDEAPVDEIVTGGGK